MLGCTMQCSIVLYSVVLYFTYCGVMYSKHIGTVPDIVESSNPELAVHHDEGVGPVAHPAAARDVVVSRRH